MQYFMRLRRLGAFLPTASIPSISLFDNLVFKATFIEVADRTRGVPRHGGSRCPMIPFLELRAVGET